LREWLTRKQKETRRGRAELLLADRAAVWNARPENRQLPSLLQWFTIRWWVQKKIWTPPQKKMMAKAGKYHAVRGKVLAVVLALVGWGGYEGYGTLKAHEERKLAMSGQVGDPPWRHDYSLVSTYRSLGGYANKTPGFDFGGSCLLTRSETSRGFR